MSVEKRRRGDGKLVYRVRWREAGKSHVRTFDQLRDAYRFDADVRRRKQLGDVGLLDAGRQRLDEFFEEWWSRYAEPFLAPKTRIMYRDLWERRISPGLGHLRLIEITPEAVDGFAHDLRQAGVGATSIQKALVVLQGAMKKAVLWGRVPSNPVSAVSRAPKLRRSAVEVPSPRQVEAIRARLGHRDATLVSVLAYAGLRPGEALALRWDDVRERTLLVERAVSMGELRPTKTRAIRAVRILGPLGADLTRWSMACGRPGGSQLVFPGREGPWGEEQYRNWRRRTFRKAVVGAGLSPTLRPYDLRHAFCSLLIAEGRSIVEIAKQMGHAPTMTLDTYGHVIAEMDGADRTSAEDAIKSARTDDVRGSVVAADGHPEPRD